MRTLDVWYARMSEQDIQDEMRAAQEEACGCRRVEDGERQGRQEEAGDQGRQGRGQPTSPTSIKAATKALRKAHTRDSLQALARFAEVVDGRYRIVSQPPVVVPLRELDGAWGLSADQIRGVVEDQFRAYQSSLSADRRLLLEKFSIVDVARKVVGVGSVGTRAFMVLLQGRDSGDPLFLQVKEATRSVLEDHLPKSRFHTPGQRVVEGQRLMQSASDIFLGWTKGVQDDRFYYWRQLRDMKASAVVEAHDTVRDDRSTPGCADGRSPARTPARVTRWPSRRTSAPGTASTGRSPSSPHGTPTRTAATTKPSSKPSRTGRIDAIEGV